ncbi:MAG TPA: DUF898 family protein [Candidatus Limnocylindrales bacterium]
MVQMQRRFEFDGGAGSFFGVQLLGALITLFTLGICYPYALVLVERWRCEHSSIDGQRLQFTGTGAGLFGLWIKWFLLCIVTLGIYVFWVRPSLERWKWEHTEFSPVPGGVVAVSVVSVDAMVPGRA